MNLKELLSDSSKATIDKAVGFISKNNEIFPDIIQLALKEEGKYAQRASRVVYYYTAKEPNTINKFIPEIIINLKTNNNDSVRATLIGIFSNLKLPDDEETLGELADICFEFMNKPGERESLKIYSMEALYKISNIYPEIKNELSLNIEKLEPYNKMAFKSRAKKILKLLYKEMGLKKNKIELE